MMIGTFGNGKVSGERTMRTKPAPSSPGISQSTMTTSGATVRMSSSPAGPFGRLVDGAHADAHEQSAHDLAHVMLVVHHQNLGGGENCGECFGIGHCKSGIQKTSGKPDE